MSWWEDIAAGVKKFLEWLGSDKTRETVEGIVKLVLLVASVAEKFNSPLTGREKREFVRLQLRFLKYATDEEVLETCRLMKDLRSGGQMECLEDWELDKVLGDSLSVYVARKGEAEPEDESGMKDTY